MQLQEGLANKAGLVLIENSTSFQILYMVDWLVLRNSHLSQVPSRHFGNWMLTL